MELNNKVLYYWLASCGASPKKMNVLLDIYSPLEVWDSLDREIKIPEFLGERNYSALKRFRNEDYLARAMDKLNDSGIDIITRDEYPDRLLQSEVNAPPILYYMGDKKLINTDCVGIVGTRGCSRYGKDMAERFSADLCEAGVTVVSGLASGIDTYAHAAALNCGGKTIAVLGSGLDRVSPVGNMALFERIAKSGLALSEYPPEQDGSKYSFPERNRIISGLSLGIVVVEAAYKSGALITATCAHEQGREVCAVPGNLTSPKSSGTNELLRNGEAHFVTCGEDVCKIISRPFHKIENKTQAIQLDIFEEKIYNLLKNGEVSFDVMVESLGFSPQILSSTLSSMEIRGVIRKKQSNIFSIE